MTSKQVTFAFPMMLVAFGLASNAMADDKLAENACERFAEHFIHTGGQIDQVSRWQCNAGPHAECEFIRQSLQKNIGNDDEKQYRYFFSLLPCGDAPPRDSRAPCGNRSGNVIDQPRIQI
jgi:hypothetical protein